MARSKDRVVVAYVHPVDVTVGFHHSLLGLLMYDTKVGGQRVANIILRNSSANITNARNKLVQQFLDDESAEWLWFVDTDMIFAPDTLDRLLDAAHDKTHPIVGGLCYGVHEGRLFPTLYAVRTDGDDGEPHVVRFDTFPENVLFEVHATGAACLLIHRSVLEAMREREFDPTFPWFQETALVPGRQVGEDVTFCFRAGLLGFPVHVHTGVHIGHQKTYVLTHEMYVEQMRKELRVTTLASLSEAKVHLNITPAVTTYDAEVTSFLDVATGLCESYTGSALYSRSVTETHDPGSLFLLRRLPVQSVTAVVVDGSTASSTSYTVDKVSGVVTSLVGTLGSDPQDVVITYTGGPASVDPLARHACLESLRHLWATQRGAMPRATLSGDEYVAGLGWSLPRRVMELLEQFRTPTVA